MKQIHKDEAQITQSLMPLSKKGRGTLPWWWHHDMPASQETVQDARESAMGHVSSERWEHACIDRRCKRRAEYLMVSTTRSEPAEEQPKLLR